MNLLQVVYTCVPIHEKKRAHTSFCDQNGLARLQLKEIRDPPVTCMVLAGAEDLFLGSSQAAESGSGWKSPPGPDMQ